MSVLRGSGMGGAAQLVPREHRDHDAIGQRADLRIERESGQGRTRRTGS